jgi:hypothetical protein
MISGPAIEMDTLPKKLTALAAAIKMKISREGAAANGMASDYTGS